MKSGLGDGKQDKFKRNSNSEAPFESKKLLLWEFCSWIFNEFRTNDLLNSLIYLSEPERKVTWYSLNAVWFFELQAFLEYIQKVLDVSHFYKNEELHKTIQASVHYFLNAFNTIKKQNVDYTNWLINFSKKEQCPERIQNEIALLLLKS